VDAEVVPVDAEVVPADAAPVDAEVVRQDRELVLPCVKPAEVIPAASRGPLLGNLAPIHPGTGTSSVRFRSPLGGPERLFVGLPSMAHQVDSDCGRPATARC
jgi:hypothetical protein